MFLFSVAWGGHFLLLRTWPGPIKLGVCTALGIVALLHFLLAGKAHAENEHPRIRVLSFLDTLLVTASVIAAGIFLAWLVVSAPF
jgi:hypothetical protein